MALFGHIVSEETRKKISLAHKGKKLSPEQKEKLRLSHLGKPAWNRGVPCKEETKRKLSIIKKNKNIIPPDRKGCKMSEESKKMISKHNAKVWLGKHLPFETRKKIGDSQRGKKMSKEFCENLSKRMKGRVSPMKDKKHTIETRLKMSRKFRGAKSHLWKGGKTKLNKIIRVSLKYKLWREAVFARDNWTCQKCLIKSKKGLGKTIKLEPHHIKSFAHYKKLRFDIDNGITLCKDCHKLTDNYGYKNIINVKKWSNVSPRRMDL